MHLSPEQIAAYREQGFLLLPGVFSNAEIQDYLDRIEILKQIDSPSRVLEKSGIVRALHGSHLDDRRFAELCRLPRMLEPARQLLGEDVYVYQFKINVKAAFGGEVWDWHQDYIFWQQEDGMPEPAATNVMIFLDEVTEFNGPLIVVPGSHRGGVVHPPAGRLGREEGGWEDDVSADLKFTLDTDTVRSMVERGGMAAPKGPRGSVLIFHPNVAHASVPNISPHHRRVLIVTYNRSDNAPQAQDLWRPEFLVSRDCTPLAPLVEAPAG